jgi:hypothetical protein
MESRFIKWHLVFLSHIGKKILPMPCTNHQEFEIHVLLYDFIYSNRRSAPKAHVYLLPRGLYCTCHRLACNIDLAPAPLQKYYADSTTELRCALPHVAACPTSHLGHQLNPFGGDTNQQNVCSFYHATHNARNGARIAPTR